MEEKFYVGKPNLPNLPLLMKRIEKVLESGNLTNNGHYVQALERYAETYLGVKHCIAVTNATAGFELLLNSVINGMDIWGNDSFLTPSFTFPAFVNAAVRRGLTPIFVDIDNDYCMDYIDAVEKIRVNTTLAFPAHLFGNTAAPALNRIGSRSYPPLTIWDSAHALGVFDEHREKYIGNFGLAEVFSLHATKWINSLEGGLITTNDDLLAENLRRDRNFGYCTSGNFPQGKLLTTGINCKMDEVRAAVGLTNFQSIQEMQEKLYENHRIYEESLPDLIKKKNTYFSNWSYVVIEVPAEKRDKLVDDLWAEGIYARTYFTPLHLTEPYKGYAPEGSLPNTERIAKRIVCLPTGIDLTSDKIKFIVSAIERSLTGGRR